MSLLDKIPLSFTSALEAFNRYCDELFEADQHYRHFIAHANIAEASQPLENLRSLIEGYYSTKFLSPLGLAWQQQIDGIENWRIPGIRNQTEFYDAYVKPVIAKGNKLVVVVSDALRYEIAKELGTVIREEDRFDADLSSMLGSVPSYTQLSMAALLPHKQLSFVDSDKGLVVLDGQSTEGTANRAKILEGFGGSAIQWSDFMKLKREESRELIKNSQVLYVYHNQIDALGDKPATEERVFKAANDAIEELIQLIKKLASANVNNIIITADHGFIYQDGGLDESGYLSEKPQGDKMLYKDRRFILGYGLKHNSSFMTFSSRQLGLSGDIEVQIPKSTHRLRLQGSGSKYVHGEPRCKKLPYRCLQLTRGHFRYSPGCLKMLPKTDKITTVKCFDIFQEEAVAER